MSYTYTNREIYPKTVVQEEPLDGNYAQCTTYEEYRTGNPVPWIELDAEHLAFKEANPGATVKEIIEKQVDPTRILNKAKSEKRMEIYSAKEQKTGFLYEGADIYVSSGERREAIQNGALNGSVEIKGVKFSVTEAKIISKMMEDYDISMSSAMGLKLSDLDSVSIVEDVADIDAQSGYPEPVSVSAEWLKSEADKIDAGDPAKMAIKFSRKIVNSNVVALTSNEALELKVLFPVWGEEGAKFGKQVEAGFRLRVVEGESDILYEVIQAHTLSAEWKPGITTASLYKVVDEEHEGTMDDPIPFFPPMELFNGKYYIQNAEVYKCTRDSGMPLSFNLADLIGQYVEVVG